MAKEEMGAHWTKRVPCVCFVCVSRLKGLLIVGTLLEKLVLSFLYVSVARTDMVSQAKGSSYVEQYDTKVVCSVFDPREIPHQNEFRYVNLISVIIFIIPI